MSTPATRPRPPSFPKVPFSRQLTVADAPLAEGTDRAPVTLRMPLSPVIRGRGALPLVPTSILFADPSYNAALASAPFGQPKPIVPPKDKVDKPMPESRGALLAVLYADRGRVNRTGSVTFMMDVAFERKLEGLALLQVDPFPKVNGDIVGVPGTFDRAAR